ncbi:MAG: 15,16-dihydrobiliverdin:ferredoxin oxidoreductase [Trichodesmium sp. St16_bin4-tuft]|uniref:Ferredoxin-dependent bilin reductase n=1 Tax=Trichodesmium erythraeum (strain IMS101) TaxID=203124 RepID=Q10UW5_TRIEI|nr:15,16-dihydrobiliverdin:ferredoxin oxidoreductase [Trichodesmium erythraeum GBRTRLIN201]MDE5071687.1 15,16-dihydrobiliverdin:ferredoxin oxidoreductase [Trichodesmium sp. St5_bin8]MDE5099831.1 15,16-dihydrobiliverdin:ferredoxin oxidoreductase [Trichodesmium sp. St16_bin4-tuft]MDE5105342.1 15,16-dihydrobiliverdin:ferredoxin oxidoreductase [Trichodesmium sp. St19_bin2]MDT9339961.1 15,16-dihydrobiliverdin:ferredoxin oxidoreductase [Trichodesmium erythraeum 21-75]
MYRPFLEYLEKELFSKFDLRSRPIPAGLEANVSNRGKNKARIQSWCYECTELRKIRYTYIDAGATAQVFNSVIYPSYCYDIPLLGIDLLSFGKNKILIVLDFQPLFQEESYLAKYIEPMRSLREKYNDLAQNLEMKFYDANQYFSKYLLFAKTDAQTVQTKFFQAYKDYISLYWQMLHEAEIIQTEAEIQKIVKAQKDYDQYSAERDPASGLFSSYFGHEWSEKFLYQFLFEDAVPLAVPTSTR